MGSGCDCRPRCDRYLGVLDLYNPPSHCAQDHDHDDPPKFETCDWKAALRWSANDTGFNEGALAAARVLLKSDIPLPDKVAAAYKARGTAGEPMTGEVWKRRDMMVFAKGLAAKGQMKAVVGVAVASQWQDCWAFRCLAAQKGNVAEWLKG
jgi:hypothetical protein